jgi:hypothetical protein
MDRALVLGNGCQDDQFTGSENEEACTRHERDRNALKILVFLN